MDECALFLSKFIAVNAVALNTRGSCSIEKCDTLCDLLYTFSSVHAFKYFLFRDFNGSRMPERAVSSMSQVFLRSTIEWPHITRFFMAFVAHADRFSVYILSFILF